MLASLSVGCLKGRMLLLHDASSFPLPTRSEVWLTLLALAVTLLRKRAYTFAIDHFRHEWISWKIRFLSEDRAAPTIAWEPVWLVRAAVARQPGVANASRRHTIEMTQVHDNCRPRCHGRTCAVRYTSQRNVGRLPQWLALRVTR